MKKTLSMLAAIIFAINLSAIAQEFYDPQKDVKYYFKRWPDPIPFAFGEKILVYKRWPVHSVVFIVSGDYEMVRDEIKKAVEKRMGVAGEKETVTDEYTKELQHPWSTAKRDFGLLAEMGIRIDRFKQLEIKTQKYNVIEKIKGYSLLDLKVINGEDIFGKLCTLIVMRRDDHRVVWGRDQIHMGLPVPIKLRESAGYITSTEIGLVEELKDRMEIRDIKYLVPKSEDTPLFDVEMMRKIKEEVENF